MLILDISGKEDIVVKDRQTGEIIVRIVFASKQRRIDTAAKLGFIADYNIAIVREKVNKALEPVPAG